MDFPTIVTIAAILFFIISCSLRKLPMAVTSLITLIILLVSGVLTTEEALSGFSDKNVILVIGMYVVSTALLKTHLTTNLTKLIKKKHSNTRLVVLICTIANVLAFQFVNGIAVVALLLPMEIALTQDKDIDISLSQIMLPSFIAGIMSMGWLPLPKAIQKVAQYNAFLERFGFEERIAMWSYTVVQIPMVIGSILFIVLLGYKWMPKKTTIDTASVAAIEARGSKGDENLLSGWREIACYVICAVTIVGMLVGDIFDVDLYLFSMIGAIVLIVLGLVTEKEAIKGIQWSAVIMIGSLLPLATAVAKTNVATLASNALNAALGSVKSENILMGIIFAVPGFITQFMSNAVTSASLTPLVAAAAPGLGLNPAGIMIAMDFACNKVVLLATMTTSCMMVIGAGGYRPKDVFKLGIIPTILCALTVMFLIPIFY